MSYEDTRAYTITEDGRAEIDMKCVAWKSRQARRSVSIEMRAQAARETTETLRRVVETCDGTQLAKYAADELKRRAA